MRQYFTFDGLKLFTSLERAAVYAVDGDREPDELRELVDGRLQPLSCMDRGDFEMFFREYTVF